MYLQFGLDRAFTEEVACGFVGSLSLFSSTSSTSVKSVPVEDGATGEGSTMVSGAFGDGGARCACFSLGFTLPGISQAQSRTMRHRLLTWQSRDREQMQA